MSPHPADPLEQVIRQAKEDWLIDSFAPPDRAVAHLNEALATLTAHARTKLGPAAPQFSGAILAQLYQTQPLQVSAFLQALRATRSPEMLLMVWRVLQGMEIAAVEMHYAIRDRFELVVDLRSPYGEGDERYRSTDIEDAAVLRHLGIMKMNGSPIFDGFYAIRHE